MVNGSSFIFSQEIMIILSAWERVARLGTLAWFGSVDSKANPVDGLSRKDFSGKWQWKKVRFPHTVIMELEEMLSLKSWYDSGPMS